jgi:hypothetical protein
MPGDDLDPFEIKGNLSVITTDDPINLGDGSIDVDGAVNTDFLDCNIDANGLVINSLKTFTKRQIDPNTVSNPDTDEHIFYIDQTDFKLKSKNSSGVITVYQPTTTKGDITVHNGTTQVRLPVSPLNNYALITDNTTAEGLKWGPVSLFDPKLLKNTITLIGNTRFSEINPNLKGTYIALVYNKIANGASGLFLMTKSTLGIPGQFALLSGSQGVSSGQSLALNWLGFEEIELAKQGNSAQEEGDYVVDFVYSDIDTTDITLTGTTWTTMPDSTTTGNYVILVSSKETEGATAVYFISKSNASLNTGAYLRLISSPAVDTSIIDVRWQSNSLVQIQKTSSNYNGTYSYIDLFSLDKIEPFTITLTGTSSVEIYKKYQRGAYLISIEGSDVKAVFSVSKNDKSRVGSINRVISSSNGSTNLDMTWSINDSIKTNKTNSNYDGSYTVKILGI